jgi:hypothetical protein
MTIRDRQALPQYFLQPPQSIHLFSLPKPFGTAQPDRPPTPEEMQRLRTLSSKRNCWIASPEENTVIGLTVFRLTLQ